MPLSKQRTWHGVWVGVGWCLVRSQAGRVLTVTVTVTLDLTVTLTLTLTLWLRAHTPAEGGARRP